MSVYLDHNATTPIAPQAREAMRPFLDEAFGNPASVHAFGQRARAAVDHARREIRSLIGGSSGDLVFTGSGTEAIFLAIGGTAAAQTDHGRHVVISAIEHRATLDAVHALADRGWRITHVPPGVSGRIHEDAVADAIRDDTVLVCVMHANNETGALQPVEEIAARCRVRGVLYHVDAVQSAGKVPVEAERWGADLVSVAAHKLGGPQGVGALWKRPGIKLQPLIGGTQEQGLRGGTHNVAAIVGFGAAAEVATAGLETTGAKIASLRAEFESLIASRISHARLTGAGSPRLPNTSHFTFDAAVGQDLVMALDLEGYAVSSGSACTSGSQEPSHVLLAMGIDPERARTAVRVSLGASNTSAEVDGFTRTLAKLAQAPVTPAEVRS